MEWTWHCGSSKVSTHWKMELSQEAETDILLACDIAYQKARTEISVIGHVEARDHNTFLVSDIIIPNQLALPTHTEISGAAMEEVFKEIEREGKNPLEYIFWGHSHGGHPAIFSGVDDNMITDRLEIMLTDVHFNFYPNIPEETVAGPFLALVANIQNKMSARCDFLHRIGDKYFRYRFDVCVVRRLQDLPEEDRKKLFSSRLEKMRKVIKERVTFLSLGGS